MSELLNDSVLENVNGGSNNFGDLPLHLCGDGQTGSLTPVGVTSGGKAKYRCLNCQKEGTINYLSGTSQYCNLN